MTETITALPTRQPDPIDVHLGGKLREIRNFRRMTQDVLADSLDVGHQQVAKYETGRDRMSAATLYRAAKALGIKPGWFFEGLDLAAGERPPVLDGEQRQLLDQFDRIPDDGLRRLFIRFAREIADGLLKTERAHEPERGAAGDAAPPAGELMK